MTNKRVTLKDISKKLNVSLSTVHKALYGKKGISDDTRKKILQTADEMDYKVNVIASTLKRKAIRIAVVLPEAIGEERYFYKDIWNGIDGASEALKDFNIEIINIPFIGTDYKLQKQVLENVYDKYSSSINGLLTVPWNLSELNYIIDKFTDADVPVVTINTDAPGSKRIACIAPPSKKIGMLAAELMSKMITAPGKVIILSGNRDTTIHTKIVEGFIKTISSELPLIDIIQIIDGNSNNTYETLKGFFTKFDDIKGLYSNNSRNTLLIGNLITEMNLKNKFKVIGTDIFDESIKFLNDDIIQAIIYQNPYMQAYDGINFLFNYITKNEVAIPREFNKISIVLKSNLDFYVRH
ncbi:substrate-binding domain-containing protein [Clostridium estertheticum]|uniref:substrate-binding domain-containing protein n=1 Tax=Clostridium estertheticum TaxID=238834 RepID=UPI001CF169D2|nr:substrate-binding domain-containing protein [Clostridium estertheticum]MCB2306030.1 substrate-binding domain-containing protein [Clostridium estertheticum]MCB2346553.1 substrate-binding domain-containing protein [Clostridium estertheticum]MCB2348999.1 substrate-binding domain-containing protein [Clostridium estertheticum]WAG47640.1 substrate-binding domain-containing protein [Clostridium estertheticum]